LAARKRKYNPSLAIYCTKVWNAQAVKIFFGACWPGKRLYGRCSIYCSRWIREQRQHFSRRFNMIHDAILTPKLEPMFEPMNAALAFSTERDSNSRDTLSSGVSLDLPSPATLREVRYRYQTPTQTPTQSPPSPSPSPSHSPSHSQMCIHACEKHVRNPLARQRRDIKECAHDWVSGFETHLWPDT
jgi:hypothetical protein